MVWVSWRVAAPGITQRQGTDVEEGEAGHCRTYEGYGIQAWPQRGGIGEKVEGMSARQAT